MQHRFSEILVRKSGSCLLHSSHCARIQNILLSVRDTFATVSQLQKISALTSDFDHVSSERGTQDRQYFWCVDEVDWDVGTDLLSQEVKEAPAVEAASWGVTGERERAPL